MALTIPLLGVLLGRLTTGGLPPRYILSGTIALGIAVTVAIHRRNNRTRDRAVPPAGGADDRCRDFGGAGLVPRARSVHRPCRLATASDRQSAAASPTVVSCSLQFLQLWYYTPPALKPKLSYLANPARALRWTGSDTIDRGYQAVARRAAVPVFDYETFISRYTEFRVYEAGFGWLLDALRDAGATIELTASEPIGRLHFVRMPDRVSSDESAATGR